MRRHWAITITIVHGIYKVGPPNDSVQLVNITMVYDTYNYSIHGVYRFINHRSITFGGLTLIGFQPEQMS